MTQTRILNFTKSSKKWEIKSNKEKWPKLKKELNLFNNSKWTNKRTFCRHLNNRSRWCWKIIRRKEKGREQKGNHCWVSRVLVMRVHIAVCIMDNIALIMIATFNSRTKQVSMVNRHLQFILNMVQQCLIITMDAGHIHMHSGMVGINNINKKKNHLKEKNMFPAHQKDMKSVSKKILMLFQNPKFISWQHKLQLKHKKQPWILPFKHKPFKFKMLELHRLKFQQKSKLSNHQNQKEDSLKMKLLKLLQNSVKRECYKREKLHIDIEMLMESC